MRLAQCYVLYKYAWTKKQRKPIFHSCKLGATKDHDILAFDTLLYGEEKAVSRDSAHNVNDDKTHPKASGLYAERSLAQKDQKCYKLRVVIKYKRRSLAKHD